MMGNRKGKVFTNSQSFRMGRADAMAGQPSKIDPAKPAQPAHAATQEYLAGYAMGKQAKDAQK